MIAARRLAVCLAIALLPALGHACDQAPALEGVLSIPQCNPASEECVPGTRAAYEAIQALEIPDVFTIGVQTSPWRMYDAEGRILTIAEVAAAVRAGKPASDRRVHLAGSWTAARPDGSGDTLAHRLSVALEGVPVDGSDGFLWLSPSGAMRTTRQAFSVWRSGPYSVARGEDVLMPLVPGAMAQFEDQFAGDNNAAGVVQAGIGFDVFMLCHERALAAFERAARMGSAIGAYNAGLIHAEKGDSVSAKPWLQLAARLGEAKAVDALERLQ
ncbi:hypothetical protein FZO89_10000 [Luteimonas viscosa]|uniref:Sel1 repeat-containing protein n=1 Tax=Luteimonas viscosa TaxID=1132694 RepID=A0A5D4XRH4_9GAMM|nr:hypothetical protein [Luteimonas viscosa]TYT26565.1 hypothetical protein FZO89_10000 [Luteimonas viscosa]